MFVEKSMIEAVKDFKEGKKVLVIQELEDGTMYTAPLEDYLSNEMHYLVNIPEGGLDKECTAGTENGGGG